MALAAMCFSNTIKINYTSKKHVQLSNFRQKNHSLKQPHKTRAVVHFALTIKTSYKSTNRMTLSDPKITRVLNYFTTSFPLTQSRATS